MNNDESTIVLINKSGKVFDELSYHEDWHYGELNDNENVSLEKIDIKGFNVSSNWTSASSTENFATPGYKNSNNYDTNFEVNHFNVAYEVILQRRRLP